MEIITDGVGQRISFPALALNKKQGYNNEGYDSGNSKQPSLHNISPGWKVQKKATLAMLDV
jgi:hypothetical protein